MTKPKSELNPLQAEKQDKAREILDAGGDAGAPGEQKPPEPVKGKRGPKPKPAPVPLDPVTLEKEAEALLTLLQEVRKYLGVDKEVPTTGAVLFKSSYPQIAEKYGASFSRYMPEVMFGASVFIIFVDTYREIQILKIAKIKAKAEMVQEQTGPGGPVIDGTATGPGGGPV